jgi:hypothetical protein
MVREAQHWRDSGRTIVVQGDTFPQPYFQSMWAHHLLRGVRVVHDAGDRYAGGYLEENVRRTRTRQEMWNRDALFFMGREWSETFNRSIPPLQADQTFALLPQANTFVPREGLEPRNRLGGVPTKMADVFAFDFWPVHDGRLEFVLEGSPGEWDLTVTAKEFAELADDGRRSGGSPYGTGIVVMEAVAAELRVAIYLQAGQSYQVRGRNLVPWNGPTSRDDKLRFSVRGWSFRATDLQAAAGSR